jgi:hypothetical protein
LAQAEPVVGQDKPAWIIRADSEGGEKLAAPRYIVNLPEIPSSMRSMAADYEAIPHKNQEETREWVDHINARIDVINAGRPGYRMPHWTFSGGPDEPAYACLSYAASAAMDWWSLQLGKPLGEYRSSINGRMERGTDPRTLELEYMARNALGDVRYVMMGKESDLGTDPVRHVPIPYQPLAYAEILTGEKSFANIDPYTGDKHVYNAADGAMEGSKVSLFTNRVFEPQTSDDHARQLAQALEKWGVVCAQMETPRNSQRLPGSHAVLVVGYFCMEEGRRLISCAQNKTDEEWAKTAYFVVHDSFGNFPPSRDFDADGGPAYRAVPIRSIDQAAAFPHGLNVLVRSQEGAQDRWELAIVNKAGRAVNVISVECLSEECSVERTASGGFLLNAPAGSRPRLAVKARHYFSPKGTARVFRLKLDEADRFQAQEEKP